MSLYRNNYFGFLTAAVLFLAGNSTLRAQDGMVRTYYPNGRIETAVFFIKDVIDGTARVFYDNGQLKEEKNYVLGVLNGWIKEYYDNGAPKLELFIKNGVKDGIMREYYVNGGIKRVEVYSEGILKDRKEYRYDSSLAVPPTKVAQQRVGKNSKATNDNSQIKGADQPNEKELQLIERDMAIEAQKK